MNLKSSHEENGTQCSVILVTYREALEAAAAKERYRKLHEAGKTDQAKADLARLALIRKEREEKAKQRAAEAAAKAEAAKAKLEQSGRKLK